MKKAIFYTMIVGTYLMIAGCSLATEKEEVKVNEGTFIIEKDQSKEMDVKINMGVGELSVSKGAENWVEGSFDTNIKNLEPIVTYANKDKKGVAVIEQPDNEDIRIGKIDNKWNLDLSEDIPMSLSIMTGAASAKLDLKELQLNKLDVETGVGELYIDLSGDWKKSFEANIKTGVGAATIVLPSEVGVKIRYEKGIGAIQAEGLILKEEGIFINEAYENADVLVDIFVEIGVGKVTFELDK